MAIQVRFFASLREQMGRAGQLLEIDSECTVADIWQRVSDGQSMPQNLLAAVNQDYAEPEQKVSDGDEVAFFPPVTGG